MLCFCSVIQSCLGVQQTTLVKFLGTRQMNSFWVDHIIEVVLVVEGVLGYLHSSAEVLLSKVPHSKMLT